MAEFEVVIQKFDIDLDELMIAASVAVTEKHVQLCVSAVLTAAVEVCNAAAGWQADVQGCTNFDLPGHQTFV